jgi:hypothetical protein
VTVCPAAVNCHVADPVRFAIPVRVIVQALAPKNPDRGPGAHFRGDTETHLRPDKQRHLAPPSEASRLAPVLLLVLARDRLAAGV